MFPDLLPGKHLILDNNTIADTYRLRRYVHQPQRDPLAPVFFSEMPWEGQSAHPLHIVYDDERAVYRMWYHVRDASLLQKGKGFGSHVGKPQPCFCCYAESEDGIKWRRPALGIYAEPPGNSVCFKGESTAQSNTFSMRPDAPPQERYLMVNMEWPTQALGGIFIARSEDGLHWEYSSDKPLIFGHSDTWNSLVYNPERQVYMLYMRAWHSAAEGWVPGKNNRRRVAYSESPDLQNWSEPQIIISPDELDTDELYGLQVFRYADYFLGQLWIYDEQGHDTIHVELTWGKDGIHWSRLPERPKFIATGGRGAADGFMTIPVQQPVIAGGEMFHYYVGSNVPHDATGGSARTFRCRMRLDGFVSLAADRRTGMLITRPFILQSDSIAINAATYSGEIRYELVEPDHEAEHGDTKGKPITGFTSDDCDVFCGDNTSHTLSWRGSSNLSTLRGKRLMLKMALTHADIWSFVL